MKIKELIDHLKTLDPEGEILLWDRYYNFAFPLKSSDIILVDNDETEASVMYDYRRGTDQEVDASTLYVIEV